MGSHANTPFRARDRLASAFQGHHLIARANMATTLPLPTRTTESQLERSLQLLDAAHDRLLAATAERIDRPRRKFASAGRFAPLATIGWPVSSRFKGLPEKKAACGPKT